MARVLLVDSQPLFNEALEALFDRDGGHKVIGRSSSPSEALAMLQSLEPDLVLVDATIGLGGAPSLVDCILRERPATKVVALGDDHDPNLLMAALRAGAAGVVGKTHGADIVLRIARGVLDGEGAVPRGMVLELTKRVMAGERFSGSPLARLSPRERQVLALLSLGQQQDWRRAVHQPAHRAHPHPEHPGEARDALQAGGGGVRHALVLRARRAGRWRPGGAGRRRIRLRAVGPPQEDWTALDPALPGTGEYLH
jgi:DNA-binding NarL/FixJ family response regulator